MKTFRNTSCSSLTDGMILRPTPRETAACLERFPLRGFLLFLMVTSTCVFVTSIWKLHVVTKTGAYRIAEITRFEPDVPNQPVTELDSLRRDLTAVIRDENKELLQQIVDRIQYLSNNNDAGKPRPSPSALVPVNTNDSVGYKIVYHDLVKWHQNLTREFWGRDWRTVVPLDDKAREFLETFETTCRIHDSPENVTKRRGLDATDARLTLCPCVPATLEGRQVPNLDGLQGLRWEDTESLSHSVLIGGYWKPSDCIARRRLAVIVPCRDRERQLRAFLVHMHPLLQKHLIEYRIFIVEQTWPAIYNKASSMNAGFIESSKMYAFDCVLFHDVDLLAEDDRSIITCGANPLHYGAHLDKWNYNIGYARIFGGAVSLTREQFIRANGYSNVYFGWGGEDDEFDKRVRNAGYDIQRPPVEVSKHSSMTHKRDAANPVNPQSGRGWQNLPKEYAEEGLNTVQYETTGIILEPLYTMIKIKLKLTGAQDQMSQEPYPYFEVRGGCRQTEDGPKVLSQLSLSLVSCRYQCDLEPSCRGILYRHHGDDHCVLLEQLCKIDRRSLDSTLYIKGANESDTNYKLQPGDCPGHDIEGVKVSLRECIIMCSAMEECVGFVYGEVLSQSCWLKNETCSDTRPTVMGVKTYTKIRKTGS